MAIGTTASIELFAAVWAILCTVAGILVIDTLLRTSGTAARH